MDKVKEKAPKFKVGDVITFIGKEGTELTVRDVYCSEKHPNYIYLLSNNSWYTEKTLLKDVIPEPKFKIGDVLSVKGKEGTEWTVTDVKYSEQLKRYLYLFADDVWYIESNFELYKEKNNKDNNMDDKNMCEAIKLLGPDVLKIKDDEELEKVFTEKKKIDAETEKKFVTAKPKKKKYLELKDNRFEFIRVTGNPDQFSELKHFCGGDITITYETCAIDDYWCITLDDCLKEKKVVVPNNDYIVKMPDNSGFTVVDSVDVSQLFNIRESE